MHFYVFLLRSLEIISQICRERVQHRAQKTFRHAALDDEEVCLISAASFVGVVVA